MLQALFKEGGVAMKWVGSSFLHRRWGIWWDWVFDTVSYNFLKKKKNQMHRGLSGGGGGGGWMLLELTDTFFKK